MNAVSSFADTFQSQASLAMSQGQGMAQGMPLNAKPAASMDDLKKVAEKFTGMFMSQMFQHMFEGVGKDALFNGGAGEEMFRSTLVDEYGKAAAKQGGMGLNDKILHALIAQQEVKS
jgi:Rod binding domain-containing protein